MVLKKLVSLYFISIFLVVIFSIDTVAVSIDRSVALNLAKQYLSDTLPTRVGADYGQFLTCFNGPTGTEASGKYTFFCPRIVNSIPVLGNGLFIDIDQNSGNASLSYLTYSGIKAENYDIVPKMTLNQAIYTVENAYHSKVLILDSKRLYSNLPFREDSVFVGPALAIYQGNLIWLMDTESGASVGISAKNGTTLFFDRALSSTARRVDTTFDAGQYYKDRPLAYFTDNPLLTVLLVAGLLSVSVFASRKKLFLGKDN